MDISLSIRQYQQQRRSHFHAYHQIVLPLNGYIEITTLHYSGTISRGECVVIHAGLVHSFKAQEDARFIVADLNQLPTKLTLENHIKYQLSSTFMHFLTFIESQLQSAVDKNIEHQSCTLFYALLDTLSEHIVQDKRIQSVMIYMQENLSNELNLEMLAGIACLSPTQFKKRFTAELCESPMAYLTRLRMEKAKALLHHTDMPINLVAYKVGYLDHSAFSRRFYRFFGISPSKIR